MRIFLAAAMTTACACRASTSMQPRPSYDAYVVAVDASVAEDPGWSMVVGALKEKRRGTVVRYDGLKGLGGLLGRLKAIRPKYVCFVAPPESAGRSFVFAAHEMLRKIDDDPYGDAVWGIVTGYDSESALKTVKAPDGGKVGGVATSMGGPKSLDGWERGVASDERTPDNLWVRREGGENERVPTGGNIAKALAGAFNSVRLDYFATSGHASERDWQIIYNRNCGRLVHTKDAGLEFVEPGGGGRHPLTNAHLRVYIGAGNCLIGHVDRRSCMATAWMKAAGVEQFCGYTVPSWYGFMGWGVKGLFESGRYSVPEARFLENERLVWARRRAHPVSEDKGLDWDRNTFAFYGDPAQRIVFPSDTTPYTVKVDGADVTVAFTRDCDFAKLDDVRGARPVMALLDSEPPGDALFGEDGAKVADAVVTERFVFIPAPGRHAAGETRRYVVRQAEAAK